MGVGVAARRSRGRAARLTACTPTPDHSPRGRARQDRRKLNVERSWAPKIHPGVRVESRTPTRIIWSPDPNLRERYPEVKLAP